MRLLARLLRQRWPRVALILLVAASAGWIADAASPSRPAAPTRHPGWQPMASMIGLNAISCASPTFCVGILNFASTDVSETFNGRSWSTGMTIQQYGGQYVGISCPVDGWCVAVNDQGEARVLSKGRWSAAIPIAPTMEPPYPGGLLSLSCPRADDCIVVDALGQAVTFAGGHWSAPSTIDNEPLNSISCPNSTFCAAVDGGGRVLFDERGHWSSPRITDQNALVDVSCADSRRCAATDVVGRTLVFDGDNWSAPTDLGNPPYAMSAVSCPVDQSCIEVASDGSALVLHGGRWSAREALVEDGSFTPPSTNIVAASCPGGATDFCMVVSSVDQVLSSSDPFTLASHAIG